MEKDAKKGKRKQNENALRIDSYSFQDSSHPSISVNDLDDENKRQIYSKKPHL
jgi:hypothetical protein